MDLHEAKVFSNSSIEVGAQGSRVEQRVQLGRCGQDPFQNGEQRVGRRASGGVGEGPRLGNSSSVRARKAVRMAEWKLFQFLHRGYCKTGVSLEATVRSSILDMLGLRFLWDFSVHSFLPQALVILGVYEREGCVWSPRQSF